MFNFEKRAVWQRAVRFADQVYRLTKAFPEEERFGLARQMRRTAASIASNIAEGASRHSRKACARFLEIAAGSVLVVASRSCLARNQTRGSEEAFQAPYAAAEEQSRMLSGPRRSLETA